VKRSKNVRLILLGTLATGALAGCEQKAPISADAVYTNNFYVPGAGYYHAPFRAFYPVAFNHFDPQQQRYFYGGQWGAQPFENITNISSPTPQTASLAEAARTDITRGGFGTSYGYHSSYFHS
jgi:hypothetical protein